MAPAGLVISKLVVEATASSDFVIGLLCLKVSLPREGESKQAARWGLFSSEQADTSTLSSGLWKSTRTQCKLTHNASSPPAAPPRPLSTPTIHSLPLSASLTSTAITKDLRTACNLLSIPQANPYPPSSSSDLGTNPFLDVSSATGQVYLVVDPASGSRKPAKKPESNGARREWMIIMKFEIEVEKLAEGSSKVLMPLPKCLDNVIRFHILSPLFSTSSSTGEVSISTEPSMLPLTPSAFSKQSKRRKRELCSHGRGLNRAAIVDAEEGWEDGEDIELDDGESEGSGDGEDESDWTDDSGGAGDSLLEGRFQSTDTLRLEWSYNAASSSAASSTLHILPQWDSRNPCVHLSYEATSSDEETIVPIEVVFPEGWAWSQLSIQGDGLLGWRSIDGDWWDETLFPADTTIEDEVYLDLPSHDSSFATIRGKRDAHTQSMLSSRSSASLMRQTLPAPLDMKMEDFSFELNGLDDSAPPRPLRPSGKRPSTPPPPRSKLSATIRGIQIRDPLPGRLFDLKFDSTSEKSFSVQGTLVPLSPLTLVSSAVPFPLPFVRIEQSMSASPSCRVTCPSARYADSAPTSGQHVCEVSRPSIGTLLWTDTRGKPIASRRAQGVRGDVRVRVQRNAWGLQTISILLPWPKRGAELAFTLPHDRPIRNQRSTMGGVALPRSLTSSDGEMEVRLASNGKDGMAEIVLEVGEGKDEVSLPRFPDAVGTMTVQLRGDGWEGVKGNLAISANQPLTFTYDLASPTPPILSIRKAGPEVSSRHRSRTLFSFSTFLNLFMLWLLVSMGQQVQRLRNEVAFVADEARDLRLYSMGMTSPAPDDHPTSPEKPIISQDDGSSTAMVEIGDKMSTALGRVVFGASSWETWIQHRTVQTLGKGMSWLWQAMVWLVAPT